MTRISLAFAKLRAFNPRLFSLFPAGSCMGSVCRCFMPMNRLLRTVVVNGSLSRPSKTRALLDAVHVQLQAHLSLQTQYVELVDLVGHIGNCIWREQLPAQALRALQAVEEADFLIIGSPVFRGSVPGLFKHLFDLLDTPALAGKPTLVVATGGSQRHALVLEHQLRPLMAFFQTLTLPVGVYASAEDFVDGRLQSSAVAQRVALAVETSLPMLYAHAALPLEKTQAARLAA